MPTKEELENELKDLKLKYQALSEEKEEAEQKAKPVYITREKKFAKYDGTTDLEDWITEIKAYVTGRYKKSDEQIDFIIEHLEGEPKQEIKYRQKQGENNLDQIFGSLLNVFGGKDTLTALQQKFFSRVQTDETEVQYSYALMDIVLKLQKKEPQMYKDPDVMLKERFAEGVSDPNLRRELKRLNTERPAYKFWELRDRAVEWLKDKTPESTLEAVEAQKEHTKTQYTQQYSGRRGYKNQRRGKWRGKRGSTYRSRNEHEGNNDKSSYECDQFQKYTMKQQHLIPVRWK